MRVLWFVGLTMGCTETAEPQLISFEVSPGSGAVGTEVTSTVEVADFELTGHSDEGHDHGDEGHGDDKHGHDHGDEDGHSDDDGAKVMKGHVHIYMDDLMTNPLLQQAQQTSAFTIPDDIEPGMHTLIARLHDAGHLIIEPQITLEVMFEVTE